MKKIMLLGLLALVLGVSSCSNKPTNENNNENEDNKDDTTDLPYCEDDDLDLDIPTFDDSTKYDYDPANLEVKSGKSNVLMPPEGSEEKRYTVTTNSTNSLIVDTSTPFSYGTIEATVTQIQANDAGIIFKCEDNGLDQFWEGTVAYYFFFLSKDGTAYLGKTDYGNWSELAVSSKIAGYSLGDSVDLKVVLKGTKILCFANDQLMFGYKDNNPLLGTSYGFRAGMSDVYFTNVSVSNEYIY